MVTARKIPPNPPLSKGGRGDFMTLYNLDSIFFREDFLQILGILGI